MRCIGLVVLALICGSGWAQVWNEATQGDAGQLPATAQVPAGSGPITTINGSLSSGDDVDLYLVRVTNFAQFSATTNQTAYPPDTQIFLFDQNGIGIAYCDDEFTGSWFGTLNVGNPLYSSRPPGLYLIGVSGYPIYPYSNAGEIFPALYPGVFGPTGIGGGQPLSYWTTGGFNNGPYTITLTGCEFVGPPPQVGVEFGATVIANQGTVQVGQVTTNGGLLNFNIVNNGQGNLQLTGNPPVALSALNNLEPGSGVQSQPSTLIIAPAGSAAFTLFADPVAPGPFSLQVSFASNDSANNPFVFTVHGNAVLPNGPAEANPAAGSSVAGGPNGPFSLSVDPGQPLSGVAIELTDVDGDNIVVDAISVIGPASQGVIAPGIPTPAHPVVLSWTGTAQAGNDPGPYVWRVDFRDAVNGTALSFTFTLTILDLPPIHAIADAMRGSGAPSNPYHTEFIQGENSSRGVNLAWVSDPNTGQSLFISQATASVRSPSGGVGFQFDLANGLLRASPAGTLQPADAGLHFYSVQVSDGSNTALIIASMLVLSESGNIAFTPAAALPEGRVGQFYSVLIEAAGGLSPYTFSLVAGNLPPGILLNPSSGTLTGTPSSAGSYQFTLRARDFADDTGTVSYQLTISDQPAKPPSSSGSSGSSGCAAHGFQSTLAMLCLFGLLAIRRRSANSFRNVP